MKDFTKYSTDYLYAKINDYMQLIKICEDYLENCPNTFLGPLGVRAKVKHYKRQIKRIHEILKSRGE